MRMSKCRMIQKQVRREDVSSEKVTCVSAKASEAKSREWEPDSSTRKKNDEDRFTKTEG